jgi:hypothetical protein
MVKQPWRKSVTTAALNPPNTPYSRSMNVTAPMARFSLTAPPVVAAIDQFATQVLARIIHRRDREDRREAADIMVFCTNRMPRVIRHCVKNPVPIFLLQVLVSAGSALSAVIS